MRENEIIIQVKEAYTAEDIREALERAARQWAGELRALAYSLEFNQNPSDWAIECQELADKIVASVQPDVTAA